MEDRLFMTKDENGNDIELKYKRPTQEILTKADLVSRTAFSRAFRDEILTGVEVRNLLKARGLWGDKQETQVRELRVKLNELEERLREDLSLSNDDGFKICDEISNLRDQIGEINSIHQSVSLNTCESMAEEQKNRFLTVTCVVDAKTGQRVYKDVADFNTKADTAMAIEAFTHTIVSGMEEQLGRKLSTQLSDEYIENSWKKDRLAKVAAETTEVESEVEAVENPKKSKRAKA